MAGTAEAVAAAAHSTSPPASEPGDFATQAPQADAATASASGAHPAVPNAGLEGVMLLLTQLITQMPATMAAAMKVDKPGNHLDNAKLDNRNFARIKTFTNKHSDWRERKNKFVYAIAECDNSFATTLSGLEKTEKPIDSQSDLTPTQAQLSSVLFNRLQAVTTGTANTMVLSAEGNGCEAWRLLNKFFDPQTDQRLTRSIMDVINFKIKSKDIQSGDY